VGLRLDTENGDVWVLCERVVGAAQRPPTALDVVERAIEREGLEMAWLGDVVIVQARTIAQGHRVASRIVEGLQRHTTR
jgi:hypothetical protein